MHRPDLAARAREEFTAATADAPYVSPVRFGWARLRSMTERTGISLGTANAMRGRAARRGGSHSGGKEEQMRTLIAAVLVGMALGLLATAALACQDDAYKPPNDAPQVQTPPVSSGS
jgi:hypothetical protein